VLDRALERDPRAAAVTAASGTWTYAELDDRARHAAGALWSLGVRPGDRVAGCLPNDLDIVAAFHGAQRIGAIWAGIGEALAASEQQELHDLVSPAAVLAGPRCQVESVRRVDLDRWHALLERDEPAPRVPPEATALDTPAGIAFTSGTSGRPKAVVHSGRNLLLPGASLIATRGWGPELRKGDSFPLTILNLIVLSPLLVAQCGGCAVLMDRRDADGVARWVSEQRVTVWNGAPAQLHDLAGRPDTPLGSLEEVWSGGSDTPDALRRAFAAAHGLWARATYGLTEAPTMVSIDPPGEDWHPGASGQLLPQFDVAAYAEDGRRLPPGETGELRLAARTEGPWAHAWTPMLGYWDGNAIQPPPPGPTPTGDLGTVDADGWLTVLDRKKLVIVRGGANVYPAEVERVLAEHPAVAAAAVCGVPDARLGERVAAVITVHGPDLDIPSLVEHCRARLARYKVPELWSQVDALPRNAMGKIQRTALARLAARGQPPRATAAHGDP
jgi:long-chain acyl-CoA synthetase